MKTYEKEIEFIFYSLHYMMIERPKVKAWAERVIAENDELLEWAIELLDCKIRDVDSIIKRLHQKELFEEEPREFFTALTHLWRDSKIDSQLLHQIVWNAHDSGLYEKREDDWALEIATAMEFYVESTFEEEVQKAFSRFQNDKLESNLSFWFSEYE